MVMIGQVFCWTEFLLDRINKIDRIFGDWFFGLDQQDLQDKQLQIVDNK